MHPNNPIVERPIDLREPNWIVLGMFGGYKSAMIQTGQGVKCRAKLEAALEIFPNAKFILAMGVAYGMNPIKVKYGDVLVSKFIDGVGNVKFPQEGPIELSRESPYRFTSVSQYLTNVFAEDVRSWYEQRAFKCTKKDSEAEEERKARVHSGTIISYTALVDNRDVLDKIREMSPEAIGGEMEGVILVEIQKRLELASLN